MWINNADVEGLGRFEEIPVEAHARLIDVNIKGVLYGSHLVMAKFTN